ncbi:hypothetical protein F2P56_012548 [Juglans regia]|uniref:Non-haem dioxygenase N-terminal domain-containing protein n=1 Tax=Juglans regia TaxID=51240 RepID=A0A834CYW4_JUGRE|nr:hypothetical protein F2P56_012548 [Juglans regia]
MLIPLVKIFLTSLLFSRMYAGMDFWVLGDVRECVKWKGHQVFDEKLQSYTYIDKGFYFQGKSNLLTQKRIENMSESEVSFDSYPLVFRQLKQHTQNFDTVGAINQVPDSDPIPVIDLQCLDLDQLGEVSRYWGLFRFVNHGVPPTLLSQLQDDAKNLFSLPFETKQAIFSSPLSYFGGTAVLTPSGAAVQIGPQNVNCSSSSTLAIAS